MNLTKHPLTRDDENLIRKIHHAAYHDVIVEQFGSWDEKVQDVFFGKSWKPETHEMILENNVPVGYVWIEHNKDHIFIHELVISPEFQGKGIGSQILKETIDEAKAKNIPVRLQVLKKNKAQNLYRRFGFKDTGTTDTHFEMELIP